MTPIHSVPRNSLERIPWWVKAAITVVFSVLGTIFTVNYTSNKTDKQDVINRITVIESRQEKLEAHQTDDHDILTHIQSQVDKASDKIDHLIINLLGEHPKP